MTDSVQINEVLKRYYRFHSAIYDLTRWSFLFGRKKIITRFLPSSLNPEKILEVGCGTGKNIAILKKRYPEARITGVDISPAMLKIAQKKFRDSDNQIILKESFYDSGSFSPGQFDLILFSYSLSMMNPGWKDAIANARYHLKKNGMIAVVDFYESNVAVFKKWMLVNHVRMDSHLLPGLGTEFHEVDYSVRRAYLGIWHYLIYIGGKSS